MNALESHNTEVPSLLTGECAKFTIDDVTIPFILHKITIIGEEYTLSFWAKAEQSSTITAYGTTVDMTGTWEKHAITFSAKSANLPIYFSKNGTYYIYHPQLEIGTVATDWVESPDDTDGKINSAQNSADHANASAEESANRVAIAETLIQQLADSISMLVTDGEGGSLMTQTADGGWTFSMAETNDALFGVSNMLNDLQTDIGNTNQVIEVLESAVDKVGELASYVRIDKAGDKPLIELGTSDREFRLLITNTDIRFTQGDDVPAYISNRALHITKAVVEEELNVGGFVIKRRANGNVGWLWKGESN